MQVKKGWVALLLIGAVSAFLFAAGTFQHLYLSLLLVTQDSQRLFHDEIAEKLRAIKETHSLFATGGLVLIGFLYGALHAIGPGHGKIIVGSYLLASKNALRRGLVITVLSSLLQACVAIALVFGVMAIMGLTYAQTEQAAAKLESLSFGLIVAIGVALLWRGLRELVRLVRPVAHAADCGCGLLAQLDDRRQLRTRILGRQQQ